MFIEADAVFNATTMMYTLTANLSWVEPEEPNGSVSQYQYSITPESNSSNLIASGMTGTTSVQHTVTVSPYERYIFSVLAETGGGLGMPTHVAIFSPEAGNYRTTYSS